MESKEFTYKLIAVLNEWDPFKAGEGGFDPEIADILQAVHDENDAKQVARRIQTVFEFSFEQLLPFGECLVIAEILLAIKNEDTCSL
ncbi:DUF1871 family protein [Bacillus sp. REN3]|uniref:DUF1871 family protein n=1 Tax=Bacillus sp. REN3 TaxID=2802440 RepID=UPI001AEEFFBB|nr:DUF1871 family protein [Bacillus sp. REN3]